MKNQYFSIFFRHFPQNENVETSFFQKNPDIFRRSVVFRNQEVRATQSERFSVKEQTLSFSKHKKLLKSEHYSWWNLNFSDGVDYFFMVVRILKVSGGQTTRYLQYTD